jgi:hypothetical protein
MSISSLSKLGVPIPGDQSPSNQGLLMPKLKYRFRVIFVSFGSGFSANIKTELTKQVMDATRPSPSFEPIVLNTYNSRIKLAGKHTWDNVTVKLRDDAQGNISRLVGEQIQKQFDFFEQSSASSGIDYKFTTYIELLDGGNGAFEPVVLERFELYGCYLSKISYAGSDYSSSEPQDISLEIAYDNALQYNAIGIRSGIGVSVGRTTRDVSTGVSGPSF